MKSISNVFRRIAAVVAMLFAGAVSGVLMAAPTDVNSGVNSLMTGFKGATDTIVTGVYLIIGIVDLVFIVDAVKAYMSKDPNASSAFVKVIISIVVSIGLVVAIQNIFLK